MVDREERLQTLPLRYSHPSHHLWLLPTPTKGPESLRYQEIRSLLETLVLELTGKNTPRVGLEGKSGVYHGAACVLFYGKATPAEYTDEVIKETAELRMKITATVEIGIHSDEARILILDVKHELHVEHAVGSLEVPMTNVQLEENFMHKVVSVLGAEKGSKVSKSLWDFKTTPYFPWQSST